MRFEIPDHKLLVHEVNVPIFWGDMDSLGHVNNTTYFKYMEQARVSWINSISGQVNNKDEGPVIANTFCNFYRPLVFPGQLVLKLYVANPGRTSIDTFVTVELQGDPGSVYAAGGATLVWISMQDGRPLPLPPFLRSLEGPLQALPGVDAPPALPEK